MLHVVQLVESHGDPLVERQAVFLFEEGEGASVVEEGHVPDRDLRALNVLKVDRSSSLTCIVLSEVAILDSDVSFAEVGQRVVRCSIRDVVVEGVEALVEVLLPHVVDQPFLRIKDSSVRVALLAADRKSGPLSGVQAIVLPEGAVPDQDSQHSFARNDVQVRIMPLSTLDEHSVAFEDGHVACECVVEESHSGRRLVQGCQPIFLVAQVDVHCTSMQADVAVKRVVLDDDMRVVDSFDEDRAQSFKVVSQMSSRYPWIQVVEKMDLVVESGGLVDHELEMSLVDQELGGRRTEGGLVELLRVREHSRRNESHVVLHCVVDELHLAFEIVDCHDHASTLSVLIQGWVEQAEVGHDLAVVQVLKGAAVHLDHVLKLANPGEVGHEIGQRAVLVQLVPIEHVALLEVLRLQLLQGSPLRSSIPELLELRAGRRAL